MAFILKEKRTVWWPVAINMPVDGGGTQQHVCNSELEILEQDEYDQLSEQRDDVKFCMRVVRTLGADITDEAGVPLDSSEDTKRKLFKSAGYVRIGFIEAYHEMVTGIKAKNLQGQPSTGQKGRKPRNKK